MDRENALRRLRALRNLSEDHGAFPAEVESAKRLIHRIEQRYRVDEPLPEPELPPPSDWAAWDWMLREFGIVGRRFLKSASADLDATRTIIIRLDTGHWQVQLKTQSGARVIAENHNPESLRAYLNKNTPHKYTFGQASGS